MLNGIVAFQIDATEIQGKTKLSQNKTKQEIENIIGKVHRPMKHSSQRIWNNTRAIGGDRNLAGC